MNIQESDILNSLAVSPFLNQRVLAENCGHSLGIVNRSVRNLIKEGYLDDQINLTKKAKSEMEKNSPKSAVILAAGFGLRMVPINRETPKALLEIHGEPLVERIIKQLHEVGIKDIYIVVGFMKERFEYLIDSYGVELIVNEFYSTKNNLYSLKLAEKYISNAYIIPCDVWCKSNPFHRYELYSWYMISEEEDSDSSVRVNRKNELVEVSEYESGNAMIGISYLIDEQACAVRKKINELYDDMKYSNTFWEEALYAGGKMIVQARVVSGTEVVEINTYEQLRELDENSNHLNSPVIDLIADVLKADVSEIVDITVLKKGMTNRSFLFSCCGKRYIMRIPGEGTDKLINRKNEAAVYEKIKDKDICDHIAYINPDKGYKITEFLEGARVCDPDSTDDLKACMKKLREFHNMGLTVEHEFDIFGQIEFYETLWGGVPSVYRDYKQTKANVFLLKEFIESSASSKCLTHVDAVCDNFLFVKDSNGNEKVRIIDWEYAGMQDPYVDIAMFCIYSLYSREQIDRLIDIYFEDKCLRDVRIRIYCYISACGLLWSNWCEYKRNLGIEFGEYSLRQYRYAKDYYRIAREEILKGGFVTNA